MPNSIIVSGGEQNDEILFTSEAEIRRVWSNDGVDNHTENLADYSLHLNEVMRRATEKVLLYLRGTYNINSMVDNVWVREKATYIACYLISIRSGNPQLYGALYEEALIELAQARAGHIDPGLNSNARVVMQSPMLDSRGFQPGLRVDPKSSTSVQPTQKTPLRYFSDGN